MLADPLGHVAGEPDVAFHPGRDTGAIVYRHQLPTSTNAPIAIAGNSVIVPAGAPRTSASAPTVTGQLVVYTVP